MKNKYITFNNLYHSIIIAFLTLLLIQIPLAANAGIDIVADKQLATISNTNNNNVSNLSHNKSIKRKKSNLTQTKSYTYPSRLSNFQIFHNSYNNSKISSELKIDMDIFGSIGKIKMGNYNLPPDAKPGAYIGMWPVKMWAFNDTDWISKWDIECEGIRIGENLDSPFMLKGLTIQMYYDEISTPDGNIFPRRITIGSDDASGKICMHSIRGFTGLINNQLVIGENLLLNKMVPTWTRRTYILNGESHGSIEDTVVAPGNLKNAGQEGFDFKGVNEGHGQHIILDKDHGIGFWAGFPIRDIDTSSAFIFEE